MIKNKLLNTHLKLVDVIGQLKKASMFDVPQYLIPSTQYCLLFFLFVSKFAFAEAPSEKMILLGRSFQQLNTQIREQTISPDSAQYRFQQIMLALRETTASLKQQSIQDSLKFIFPIRGYTPQQIGGHGSGFRPNRFNLFDHSVQGSHPAHDIFIFDRNRDNLDDQTEQPVDVLAMRGGIVLATETNWADTSLYRGGNFVWVYDPCLDGLFYYAHNSRVVVQVGEQIQAGQKIAEVGRTGFNAAKPRSGTHLHLMYLQLSTDALPEPFNTYDWLVGAERVD